MHSSAHHDVLIVGAGPAGSAAAILLARAGVRVGLVDRAHFPRPKPCAEYLSPEAGRVLSRLGVLGAVSKDAPARLCGMRIVSPRGISFLGRFAADHGYRGFTDYGLALPRERLDSHLFDAAVDAGASVYERTTAETFAAGGGSARLRVRHAGGRTTLHAPLVVGADGLHSRIGRALGVTKRGRRRRVALVTHAEGVTGIDDVGEMHVGRNGYLGLAPVGRGLTNVAVVLDTRRERIIGSRRRMFRQLVDRYTAVRERLADARLVTPVRAVGPFGHWTTRATGHHALLVGDAADFYDPFTGEGIFAALRGAEFAAARVLDALARGTFRAGDLARYDRDRRTAFRGKWIVERLVSSAVAMPVLFDRIASRLARRPALADLLVGVTGDFVPPSRVLRPSFLWQLVR